MLIVNAVMWKIKKNQDGGDHVVVRSERTKSYLLEMITFLYTHSQLRGREEKLGKYI